MCIPKGDKPKEYIKNWRPISLLNVVYKIGSSCIANRLKEVLPSLLNESKRGLCQTDTWETILELYLILFII